MAVLMLVESSLAPGSATFVPVHVARKGGTEPAGDSGQKKGPRRRSPEQRSDRSPLKPGLY